MSVPSTRECLHQLDRLRDTPQLVADLNEFAAELEIGMYLDPLIEASARLTILHQLCLHMAKNMSGGAGIPPTPGSGIRAKLQTTAEFDDRKPPISKHTPAMPVHKPAKAAQAQPKTTAPLVVSVAEPIAAKGPVKEAPAAGSPNTCTTVEAAEMLRISMYQVFKLRTQGKLADPVDQGRRGAPMRWSRADIERLAAERAANPPRRGRPTKSSSTTKGST